MHAISQNILYIHKCHIVYNHRLFSFVAPVKCLWGLHIQTLPSAMQTFSCVAIWGWPGQSGPTNIGWTIIFLALRVEKFPIRPFASSRWKSTWLNVRGSEGCVFRWFKFTLKPPYTVAHGNFLSAIWGTSHWTPFVKFGLKTAWDISYDILWPILKYVNFWQLQGRLSNLSKKDAFRKSIFSQWRSRLWRGLGVLGGQVPRLYGGTILGGVQHTWGVRQGI